MAKRCGGSRLGPAFTSIVRLILSPPAGVGFAFKTPFPFFAFGGSRLGPVITSNVRRELSESNCQPTCPNNSDPDPFSRLGSFFGTGTSRECQLGGPSARKVDGANSVPKSVKITAQNFVRNSIGPSPLNS